MARFNRNKRRSYRAIVDQDVAPWKAHAMAQGMLECLAEISGQQVYFPAGSVMEPHDPLSLDRGQTRSARAENWAILGKEAMKSLLNALRTDAVDPGPVVAVIGQQVGIRAAREGSLNALLGSAGGAIPAVVKAARAHPYLSAALVTAASLGALEYGTRDESGRGMLGRGVTNTREFFTNTDIDGDGNIAGRGPAPGAPALATSEDLQAEAEGPEFNMEEDANKGVFNMLDEVVDRVSPLVQQAVRDRE